MPRSTKSTARKRPSKPKAAKKKNAPRAPKGSPEYLEYLERHAEFGEGRPRLTPAEFEKLDDEFLELLELSAGGHELSAEQDVRVQELEFLLIDSAE